MYINSINAGKELITCVTIFVLITKCLITKQRRSNAPAMTTPKAIEIPRKVCRSTNSWTSEPCSAALRACFGGFKRNYIYIYKASPIYYY